MPSTASRSIKVLEGVSDRPDRFLGCQENLLATSGISANHFLNSGSVPYTLAVSKNRTPWLKDRRSRRSMKPPLAGCR